MSDKEPRHVASVALTLGLLERQLQLPDGMKIVGADWDFNANAVRLYLEGPQLEAVKWGEIAPALLPSITRDSNGHVWWDFYPAHVKLLKA